MVLLAYTHGMEQRNKYNELLSQKSENPAQNLTVDVPNQLPEYNRPTSRPHSHQHEHSHPHQNSHVHSHTHRERQQRQQ